MSSFNFPVKSVKLSQNHCTLNGIHTPTNTNPRVVITPALPVYPDLSAGLRQGVIVGENGTAVTITTQGLAGKKASAANRAEVAALSTSVSCAEALRRIFYDGNIAVASCDGVDLVHISDLPVQADGHDRSGSRRYFLLNLFRVDIAGVRLDINEDRLGAKKHYHLNRCDKGKGGGDYLVTRLQIQCHQRNQQRLGTTGHSDAMFGARVLGQPVLKLADLWSHNVLAVIKDFLDSVVDRCAQSRVLGFEIYKAYWLPAIRCTRTFTLIHYSGHPGDYQFLAA